MKTLLEKKYPTWDEERSQELAKRRNSLLKQLDELKRELKEVEMEILAGAKA